MYSIKPQLTFDRATAAGFTQTYNSGLRAVSGRRRRQAGRCFQWEHPSVQGRHFAMEPSLQLQATLLTLLMVSSSLLTACTARWVGLYVLTCTQQYCSSTAGLECGNKEKGLERCQTGSVPAHLDVSVAPAGWQTYYPAAGLIARLQQHSSTATTCHPQLPTAVQAHRTSC
jgi:hypothetical protein